MTAYTNNLRIPHLDQNVSQPEIPENTAKEIIDKMISGQHIHNMTADSDYTFVHTDSPSTPSDWQNGLIEITDTGVLLTTGRSIIVPANKRTYIFVNSTVQSLTFKVSGQTGVSIASGGNIYAICNGTDIERLQFAADGAGMYLGTLNDVDSGYGSDGQVLVTDGTDSFTYIDRDIGTSSDVPVDYGDNDQALLSNGTDSFTYKDIVQSDTTVIGSNVSNMIFLTQIEYDGITPDNSTFYIIKD